MTTAVDGPVTVGDPLTLLIHMKSEKGKCRPVSQFIRPRALRAEDSNRISTATLRQLNSRL